MSLSPTPPPRLRLAEALRAKAEALRAKAEDDEAYSEHFLRATRRTQHGAARTRERAACETCDVHV
jgi:hypothetical protein